MKCGINTFLWTASFDASHLDLLPRIKEWGFDGIEIARFSFHDCPAAPIRQALASTGFECTFCTALTGQHSMASKDGKALEYLKEAIHWAADVGAQVVAGPFA